MDILITMLPKSHLGNMFDFSSASLAGIDFLHLLCCGLCSIDVSIVKIISYSVSSEIKSIFECWISVVGPNPLRSIQPSRAFGLHIKKSTGIYSKVRRRIKF